MKNINKLFYKNIQMIEMTAVVMRIFSFTLVSWQGSESPFLLVWLLNSIDASILSWAAWLKKDRAYLVLNVFWILVGLIGVCRALGLI